MAKKRLNSHTNHNTTSNRATKPRHSSSTNGDGGEVTPVSKRDVQHVQEAIANPGAFEIPDSGITKGVVKPLEIPEVLGGSQGNVGQLLDVDPALLGTKLGRPSPHLWVRLYRDRILRTELLAFKPRRDGSADHYYVAPELQKALARHLKPVLVLLVGELGEEGDTFLWIVSATTFSPYYNAAQRILALSDKCLNEWKFLIPTAVIGKRDCDVRQDLIAPDDPDVVLPSRSVGLLLYEALSPQRVISDTGHPVYRSLMSGRKL